jgi:thiol-disulfide isomerase/thioredoxin
MRRIVPTLLLLAATAGCHKQAANAPQARSIYEPTQRAVTETALPLTKVNAGKLAPKSPFEGPDGKPMTIADFKGKPTLVNLWATWCVPCVKELPTIEALAKAQADKLNVVAVSEDIQGRGPVDAFWKAHKLAALTPYLDKDNGLMLALREGGLPVTIYYDADGKELWRLQGDLDWNGAKAKQLLSEGGI